MIESNTRLHVIDSHEQKLQESTSKPHEQHARSNIIENVSVLLHDADQPCIPQPSIPLYFVDDCRRIDWGGSHL